MKLHCLIVDDEPLAVQLLESYVEAVPYLELAGKCHSPMEAMALLRTKKIDLVFLDINMPRISGLELALEVQGKAGIIFTTAYSEYAVESYELDAVDYLLKPITFVRFVRAVNKALDELLPAQASEELIVSARPEEHFFVKSGKAIVQVSYSDVRYIEGLKDYVSFHTPSGNHLVYKRMKDLELSLPAHFIRVHNSYIINRHHLRRIEEHQVFIDGNSIPVSEKYRDAFYSAINRQLL